MAEFFDKDKNILKDHETESLKETVKGIDIDSYVA